MSRRDGRSAMTRLISRKGAGALLGEISEQLFCEGSRREFVKIFDLKGRSTPFELCN